MISISTAWNVAKHEKAAAMVKEMTSLGFKTMELNFTITPQMLGEIEGLVNQGKIKVVSMHNFCPIPEGLDIEQASPDYYNLASTDPVERGLAVKYTKVTIDNAQRLGAEAVVVHAGYVDIKERIRSLIALYNLGRKQSDDYAKTMELMRKERGMYAKPQLEELFSSLGELNKYAGEKNIKIGIENRFYFREIPSLDEAAAIMREFAGSNIYYWHDVGHAQVAENLGLVPHMDWLESCGSRLIGVHLHNVKGASDHRAPLDGDFDFSRLKPYIKKGILLVIESHYPATGRQIKEGLKYFEELFKQGE